MKSYRHTLLVAAVVALVTFTQTLPAWSRGQTVSPIKHLIVVVGETRSFDNVFATYTPSDPSQKVWNLLSRGIVLSTGAPGPNIAAAAQWQASSTTTFELSPSLTSPFGTLPQPNMTLLLQGIGLRVRRLAMQDTEHVLHCHDRLAL